MAPYSYKERYGRRVATPRAPARTATGSAGWARASSYDSFNFSFDNKSTYTAYRDR